MKSRTELDKDEEEQLLNYLISIGKRQTGLQDKTHHKKPPSEFTNSYNLNHPELRKGQRLYINDLCHIYASTPSKKAKHEQFLKLLQRQKDIDKKCREEFSKIVLKHLNYFKIFMFSKMFIFFLRIS
jgi:hypothetical protein